MQLHPRYDGEPVITLDNTAAAIIEPNVRHRQRFSDRVAALTDDEWRHQSRCDQWTTRDVVVHLNTVNFFWTMSIQAGLAGEPTTMLKDFDVAASPAEMVASSTDSIDQARETFIANSAMLNELISSLGDTDLATLAEAPTGHLPIGGVLHHAIWDSWTHERDIFVPLGHDNPEHADEVLACLRYVAAINPTVAVLAGTAPTATFDVVVDDPDASFQVNIGDSVDVRSGASDAAFVLRGQAVPLLEALTARAPMTHDIPAEFNWAFAGLHELFEN